MSAVWTWSVNPCCSKPYWIFREICTEFKHKSIKKHPPPLPKALSWTLSFLRMFLTGTNAPGSVSFPLRVVAGWDFPPLPLQQATEDYKKMAGSLLFPGVPGGYGPTAPVRLPRRIHHLYPTSEMLKLNTCSWAWAHFKPLALCPYITEETIIFSNPVAGFRGKLLMSRPHPVTHKYPLWGWSFGVFS